MIPKGKKVTNIFQVAHSVLKFGGGGCFSNFNHVRSWFIYCKRLNGGAVPPFTMQPKGTFPPFIMHPEGTLSFYDIYIWA